MNRALYYGYIEERLITLSRRVEVRGKINILDYHIHSENFYRDLFNKLYTWKLENLNIRCQNVEAIDLVDRLNKIIVQVSATNTKSKIDNSLSKSSLSATEYEGFTFKFISIAKDAAHLRAKTYNPPKGIIFVPSTDIYDVVSILKDISSLDIETLKIIYSLIERELGRETEVIKLQTNLAAVINILSKENLVLTDLNMIINDFEIERKMDFNNLNTSKVIIDDYKLNHHIVDKIYSEFDKSGMNKSISVLNAIRDEYMRHSPVLNSDELFTHVISALSERILQSPNFEPIPKEELMMCVEILVVDAFIRCKIFKNPDNYTYATP